MHELTTEIKSTVDRVIVPPDWTTTCNLANSFSQWLAEQVNHSIGDLKYPSTGSFNRPHGNTSSETQKTQTNICYHPENGQCRAKKTLATFWHQLDYQWYNFQKENPIQIQPGKAGLNRRQWRHFTTRIPKWVCCIMHEFHLPHKLSNWITLSVIFYWVRSIASRHPELSTELHCLWQLLHLDYLIPRID